MNTTTHTENNQKLKNWRRLTYNDGEIYITAATWKKKKREKHVRKLVKFCKHHRATTLITVMYTGYLQLHVPDLGAAEVEPKRGITVRLFP